MSEALTEVLQARPRRFRPYPEYRDSGVEWLGEIPANREVKRLKYVPTTNDDAPCQKHWIDCQRSGLGV